MEEKILSDFNLYQKKAHETANYPSGTIRKEAHTVDYIYPALGLAEEAGKVAGKLLSKVTVTTAVPNKLYAYGTAEGVVFLKAIPSADTAEVAVYVPSATGLTAGTGSYTKETDTVTVSTDSYARYTDGDFQI